MRFNPEEIRRLTSEEDLQQGRDLDEGGWTAFEKLQKLLPSKVVSCADRYRMYDGKDLNDYHRATVDWTHWHKLEDAYQASLRGRPDPAESDRIPDVWALP